MREIFLPKRKKVDRERLKQLIIEAESAYEFKQDYSEILAQINEILPSSKDISIFDIHSYSGVCTLDEFIDDLLIFKPEVIDDISRDDVLSIVTLITENPCDENVDYYTRLLRKNFPNGNASDLIFNPNALGYDLKNPPSVDEITDLIFKSKRSEL